MKIVEIIRTAKNTNERLKKISSQDSYADKDLDGTIKINPGQIFQEILGFGGAFTEAAAVTLSKIDKSLRDEVIEMYFDPGKGLGYNLGRVHINSCDFALNNYTYVEDLDRELKSFDIKHDLEHIIPLIKDSQKQAGKEMFLLASPWSPPAWMKSNNEMNNGGKLLDEYKDVWAEYYVKFIESYKKENIDIWGITVQNEPEAVQIWDSCIYTAEEERDFIKNNLGPALAKGNLGEIKLLIWDHNRDRIVDRAKIVLEDRDAAKYIWGTGFHWYVSEEFENVGKVHDLFPQKHLLFTEGCQEYGCQIGEWFTGERYARNMIGDFNNWNEGFLDWNLVLDETGGPNHVNNLCDAPIIVDTTKNKLHYNSSYYYIGQFSRYIKPGSFRVLSESKIDMVSQAAFVNKDDSLVVVVLNEGEQEKNIQLQLNEESFNVNIPEHSISTYILTNGN